DVLAAVVAAVGVRDSAREHRITYLDVEDPRTRLVDALSVPTVLVLDNCEHVLDDTAALVEDLLRRCPGLTVLATSREALGVEGEVLHPLAPLRTPAADADLEAVRENAAIRLFSDRAAAVSPGFTVSSDNAELVADLVRRLDGLPLALELAAARLRTMSVVDLHARLSDRFRLLTGGRRTAVARHRTLRAVVDWSWDLLLPDEQSVLQRLSVFNSPVSVEAATAVNADIGDDLAVSDVLGSLTEKSLLQLRPGSPARYGLLETIREYGAERLAASGGLEVVCEARTAWARTVAVRASSGLRGPHQVAWSKRLDAEADDLLAALRQLAAQGRGEEALSLAVPVTLWWTALGRHAPARAWIALARSATPTSQSSPTAGGEGSGPSALAVIAEPLELANRAMAGESSPGEPLLLDRLGELRAELAGRTGESPLLATAELFLGLFLGLFSVDSGESFATAPEELPGPVRDDPWLVALYDLVRASAAENRGNTEVMAVAAASAERGFRAVGESYGLTGALALLAQVRVFSGDLEAARASYAEAGERVAAFGSGDDEVRLRMQLVDVLQRQGRDVEARTELARMRTLATATSAPMRTWVALSEMSFARREGRLEEARDRAEGQLVELSCRDPVGVWSRERAALLAGVAHVYLDMGDFTRAATALQEGYPIALETHDMPIVAIVAVGIARWLGKTGRWEDAAEVLGAAATLRGADDPTQPDVARLQGELTVALGEVRRLAAYQRGRRLIVADALARVDPGR
ncbi:MAG: ATP-binding protein, partial [Janthinobacterium lividum]